VKSQTDPRWHHIIVDDISTDGTWAEINKNISNDERFTQIRNTEKKFALKNIIDACNSIEDPEAVIGVIDGDDSLCNINTVRLILDEYEKGNDVVWTGHRWDINNINISREMPRTVNPYQWPWSASHFRTFRLSLLSKINEKNFKDMEGCWFKRGYDQALLLPLLALTHNRKYIDEICYLYNIDSASIPSSERDWCEATQIATVNLVRSRGFIK
jgi:glycosyltransferase involved in cell wall biosynthesis